MHYAHKLSSEFDLSAICRPIISMWSCSVLIINTVQNLNTPLLLVPVSVLLSKSLVAGMLSMHTLIEMKPVCQYEMSSRELP